MSAEPLPVELLALDDLEPHPDNPREADVGAIVESIATNGWWGAVVSQIRDGEADRICAGEHRWRALAWLAADGWQGASYDDLAARGVDLPPKGRVPVWRRRISDVEALRVLIADNAASDRATNDRSRLAELLTDLQAGDGLAGTLFSSDDLDDLLAEVAADEAKPNRWDRTPPEPLPHSDTKPGDRWWIGDHLVVCGDSTDPAVLADIWPAGPVAVVTDPPYGVGYTGGAVERQPLRGDERGPEFRAFTQRWVEALAALTPGGSTWMVFSGADPVSIDGIYGPLRAAGIVRWNLVWVKEDQAPLSRADFNWRHELIWYGWTPGGSHYRPDDRTRTSVFEHARPAHSKDHPTAKPVPLMRDLVACTDPAATIIDPFGGSGTTATAAAAEHRASVTIEAEPAYVDVIVRRLHEIIGDEPVMMATDTSA